VLKGDFEGFSKRKKSLPDKRKNPSPGLGGEGGLSISRFSLFFLKKVAKKEGRKSYLGGEKKMDSTR